jgi:hypothetical protein
MPHSRGIVVVDTNCIRHFEDERIEAQIRASLEAADFEIWPSAINVLEVLQYKNVGRRERLLRVLSQLSEGRGVLPLPMQILRASGQALARGLPGFETGMSGLEEMLVHDPSNVDPALQAKSEEFLARLESNLDEAHAKTRPLVRKLLSASGAGWASLPNFLDEVWTRVEFQDLHLQRLWKSLDLPGDAPLTELLQCPPWKLLLDAHGAAAFERDIVLEQPKRVHHADLLQLVYAAGYKRILLTDEEPLTRVATGVLVGRYQIGRAHV